VSKGILQHDMWHVKAPSNRWDWEGLRAKIAQHGIRNSLLLAPMPTASTSQVHTTWHRQATAQNSIGCRLVSSGENAIMNSHCRRN